jgi:hypothetical protein
MAAPAASQMSVQQPYQQHVANIDSMASLNLNQPAAVPTFDAHANVGAGYEGIQMPANNNGGQVYGRNNYDSADNTFQQHTGAQMPQGMYGVGLDSTGVASSTGAMGLNAKMMLNMNSAFGMEQDTATPTGQTSQQSLLYQQQQQYMMAMASSINSFGGFPGAYSNMAALYGAYGMGAGYSAGYGGMPNSMGYGGMPNAMNNANLQSYSGNSTGQGYGNSNNKQHHNRKQPNYNSGYGGNYAGNSYGNNSSDSSSHFQSSYSSTQQQQQQLPSPHPFGGSMGASSRMSTMWSN